MKIKTLLLIFAIPIALILIIEIGLRLFNPAPPMPVIESRFDNILPGLTREVVWQSNDQGMRGSLDGDGPLVLALGADNTGHFLQNDENTWWGVMGETITSETGRPVRVAAGLSPSVPASWWLGWLRGPGAGLKPDVVVLSIGLSEITTRPPGYRFRQTVIDAVHQPGPTGLRAAVISTSQIAAHLRLRRLAGRVKAGHDKSAGPGSIAARLSDLSESYHGMQVVSEIPWEDDPGDELVATLRAFKEMAADRGFRLVVALEPWPHAPVGEIDPALYERFRSFLVFDHEGRPAAAASDPAWIANRMQYIRTRTAASSDGLEIPFVDGMAATPGSTHFFDDVLLSDDGAAAYGKIVASEVAKLLP